MRNIWGVGFPVSILKAAKPKGPSYLTGKGKPQSRPTRPAKRSGSAAEQRFERLWVGNGFMPLCMEYVFHPTRKWRFDFAHIESKVAIEIHGGVYIGGRHTRGKGFTNDCEKKREAILDGWAVFELTPEQINSEVIREIFVFIRGRVRTKIGF